MTTFARTILTTLADWGIPDAVLERGGKHPRVRFTANGRSQFYVIPATPSDRRAILNALADLRKIVQPARPEPRATPRRERRRAPRQPTQMPKGFTVRPNPLLALQAVQDAMARDRQRAREAGQRAFLSGDGSAPPDRWPDYMAQEFRNGFDAARWLVGRHGYG